MRRFLSTSFGSALVGGAVVAAFGWIAIAAGWIQADGDGSTVTVSQPLAAPIAASEEGDANLVNQIYKRDGQGVAFISAKQPTPEAPTLGPFGQPEGEEGPTATGSGFLIDTEGHVITNSHVVGEADEVDVKLGSSEQTYSAEVVGTDPATDVALLKVDAPADSLHPLALGDSSRAEVGDPVVAIGNPFGLDRTVTSGIVSALQRQIQAPNGFSISHVIQTDAAINPGNSGGPLIDATGSVIGINTQIQTGGSSGNVGIGFAVPINTAREVVQQLKDHGEVKHAYLGISGGSLTPELAKALKIPEEEGVLVNEVVKGGPADEAGVKGGETSATIEGANLRLGGDVITEIDGKKVTEMEDVINAVNAASPGDEMELSLDRDGENKTVTVTLGVRPDSAEEVPSR